MTERKEERGSTEMVDLEMYLTTGEKILLPVMFLFM